MSRPHILVDQARPDAPAILNVVHGQRAALRRGMSWRKVQLEEPRLVVNRSRNVVSKNRSGTGIACDRHSTCEDLYRILARRKLIQFVRERNDATVSRTDGLSTYLTPRGVERGVIRAPRRIESSDGSILR